MSIGIVTAATGAAVQDIINISRRRNPYVRLVLFPAKVQGEGAADTIIEGIRRLDEMGLDVLIVGRGGGSIEDLWAFNEESVARAIFECQTPVISAVGHETDVTIADYVADLRAPTPSAAAELAVFEYAVVEEYLAAMEDQLYRRLYQKIRFTKTRLEQIQWRLNKLSPQNVLQEKRRHVTDIQMQMKNRLDEKLLKRKHQLALYVTKLEAASPLKKLSSGYAYAQIKNQPIKSIEQVAVGDVLDVTFTDGTVKAEIKEKKPVGFGKAGN
jgi:exodeoxyribonuclease VII large subunit